MKAKIKENSGFNAPKSASSLKRPYYFHADEDFREDWDWGTKKEDEVFKRNPARKSLKKI